MFNLIFDHFGYITLSAVLYTIYKFLIYFYGIITKNPFVLSKFCPSKTYFHIYFYLYMGPHKQYVYIRKSVSCERVSLQVPNAGVALTSY